MKNYELIALFARNITFDYGFETTTVHIDLTTGEGHYVDTISQRGVYYDDYEAITSLLEEYTTGLIDLDDMRLIEPNVLVNDTGQLAQYVIKWSYDDFSEYAYIEEDED